MEIFIVRIARKFHFSLCNKSHQASNTVAQLYTYPPDISYNYALTAMHVNSLCRAQLIVGVRYTMQSSQMAIRALK